ncbi:Uncharacterised protein [uncultured archaeon]|nr:Uncharacterised protein [uncultured archaeon]
MNQKNLYFKRNENARLFHYKINHHRNVIYLNTGNSLEHERKKFEVAYAIQAEGHEFITEAEFKTPEGKIGRVDVVNLDTGICIEILSSEKEESIAKKKEFYPLPIEIIRA